MYTLQKCDMFDYISNIYNNTEVSLGASNSITGHLTIKINSKLTRVILLYFLESHSPKDQPHSNYYEELTLPEDVGVFYSSITGNGLSLANKETPENLSKGQYSQEMLTAGERPQGKSGLSYYLA